MSLVEINDKLIDHLIVVWQRYESQLGQMLKQKDLQYIAGFDDWLIAVEMKNGADDKDLQKSLLALWKEYHRQLREARKRGIPVFLDYYSWLTEVATKIGQLAMEE